jgi:hypothetical protein
MFSFQFAMSQIQFAQQAPQAAPAGASQFRAGGQRGGVDPRTEPKIKNPNEKSLGRSRFDQGSDERKIVDWSEMFQGQVLWKGETGGGRCGFPRMQVRIPKPSAGTRRYYLLKANGQCQIVVESVGTTRVSRRTNRLTMFTRANPQAKNLLFTGGSSMRKTSWYYDSLYGSGYFHTIGESANVSIESSMNYQYDVEWPGGLAAITGASANCGDDNWFAHVNLCQDPWFSYGYEEGPGSSIIYGATAFFDVPDRDGHGHIEAGFVIDGYGNGFCQIGTFYTDNNGGGHNIYAGGDCY